MAFSEHFPINQEIALIDESGKNYSYNEINAFTLDFSNYFEKKDLVFCLCQNTPFSIIGYLTFFTNDVVPLLLDSTIEHFLLVELIELYKPKYLWIPTKRKNDFTANKVIFEIEEYILIESGIENPFPIHDDLALLLTTSGSTGSPKLVRLSWKNIYSNATSIAQYLSISSLDRPITTLPMNYSFGLSIINSHLIKGATILLTNKSLMEKDFWEFLKLHQATTISGVPYTFEMLKRLRFFRMDLPSIKIITQAGGKLSNDLIKEFAEHSLGSNRRFYVMYGQTEATARMSYLPFEKTLEKLGSIGIEIPGGKFELIDENKNVISNSNQTGELVYSGDNVSLGYAENGEDLIKGDENDGILFTGDLAYKDEDGFFYIVGRKKRFIKLFGNRVNLDETEQLIKKITPDCACIGNDDKMVIYLTDESKTEEVKKYITHLTGIHHSAFSIRLIDEIPKNPSGKTIYSKLSI